MDSKQWYREAEAIADRLRTDRRELHAHPETGFDLKRTCAYVCGRLEQMGYTPKPCGRAGLVALVGTPGPVFLLRADMDALPIREETEEPFASENGAMHACGHDFHTAMLLGAAALLKAHESELRGTVKLMFQPAEELFEGSIDMLAAGVLRSPAVDAGMMIHVTPNVPIPAGTVLVSAPGVSSPAADYFTIEVHGKGCHGSMPDTGIDPLNAAAHILIAVQEIHARELAMGERAALTFGTVRGGTAVNAIPDTVTMGGSIRSFDEESRAFLKRRLQEIAGHVAAAFGARADVKFGSGAPTLQNDAALSAAALRYAKETLGEQRAFSTADFSGGRGSSSGSEDFAYLSHEIPTIMLALAAGEPKHGHIYPTHHPKVTFDESALASGAAVYAAVAFRYLEEHA